MVTREIPDSKIRYWTDSVTHFGYNYEILERDRPWKGWAQRTKAYLDAARRAQGEKIPYLCFTDATDVFFCGSSWELYDKLRNSPSDALIGAERILYYNDTNSKRYQVERELDARAQGRYPFPNGGFLTGQTEALIEILERNLVAHDDQKGYCDLILETFGVNVLDDSEEPLRALQPLKCRFTIDYHGDFVANIPNYGLVGWIEEQIWNLDCGRPERVEPITQADQTSQTSRLIRPIALHFPGNSPAIHDFHDQLVKPRVQTVDEVWEVQDQSSDEEGWPWYYWVIIGLFILIVIIVLLILIFKNNSSSPNNSK